MRGWRATLLLLFLAPLGTQDRGCRAEDPTAAETRAPGDPGANEGAAGRVNATADEQRATDPAARKPGVP